ncbi:endoglucanase-like [Haliotis rufescens]|uniref:endoglucanase-like n=1 Tax=Haliotis rufescens TaxID=6454 RepID=UPI001EAFB50F|nr:endoglucanase-like [Haliotis rufescens]
MKTAVSILLLFAASAWANQKCQLHNGIRTYNGKHCASTTRYNDGHKGACGCGQNDTPFPWNNNQYVAAANQKLFSNSGSSWCGDSCGKCVKLTTTGGSIPGAGTGAHEGQSHVFMITNDCPDVAPNLEWCAQKGAPGSGHGNTHGYEVHFDLENNGNQISKLGWDNPEVTWEWSSCHGSNTPTDQMWHTCECSH